MRTVPDRLKEAVRNLGASVEGHLGQRASVWGHPKGTKGPQTTLNDTMGFLVKALVTAGNAEKNSGGRSRTRTYDLAHVRRAL